MVLPVSPEARGREGPGKLEKLKIGEYRAGGMTLAEARGEAERQRKIADDHGSARKHRNQQRRERRAALVEQKGAAEREAYTFRVMATEYLRGKDALKLAPKTQRDISKSLERSTTTSRRSPSGTRRTSAIT